MFPHLANAFYILVLVILCLCLSLCASPCILCSQPGGGGVSPRAKHMLLSIALIQMQRGGIIARVAVASQGLGFVPHWLPSARHTPLQSTLSLSLYQTSDLLSNQTLTLHKRTGFKKAFFIHPVMLLLLSGHHIWGIILINIVSAPHWPSFFWAKRLHER